MKPSPLQQRISAALAEGGMVEILTDLALSLNGAPDSKEPVPLSLSLIDRIFEVIAAATPAEIVEEGTYLLGSSHMWADTQGSKATEHMVRRITAADQIVRSRLELEVNRLTDLLAEVEWTCEDPDSKSSPLFCPRCGGLEKADKESGTPAGHAIGCQLAAAIDRNT